MSVPRISTLLLDTGPLLALVNRRDQHHEWARNLLSGYSSRLLTCEAVISEAWFLAQSRLSHPKQILMLLERLPLEVKKAWSPRVLELIDTYADLPMEVADACLVAMAEDQKDYRVATTDVRDFSIYRLKGGRTIPTLMPTARG